LLEGGGSDCFPAAGSDSDLSRVVGSLAMNTALLFLLAVGILGAFDTIYYHEWNLRLPEASFAGRELKLHAARDFVYAILFGSLGWVGWHGAWTWVLVALLLAEITI